MEQAELTEAAYDYLMQIRKKDNAIRRKELQCEQLKSCLLPGAIRYDLDKVQNSPSDQMSEIFGRISEIEDDIKVLHGEKAKLIIEISDTIESLEDDNEKTVLSEFYVGRIPMTIVAEDINYSPRRAYYFRKQGAIHLSARLKDGEHCKNECATMET